MRTANLDNISARYAGMNIAKQYLVRWSALGGSQHEWTFRALTTQGAVDRIKTFMEVGDTEVVLCDNYGEPLQAIN